MLDTSVFFLLLFNTIDCRILLSYSEENNLNSTHSFYSNHDNNSNNRNLFNTQADDIPYIRHRESKKYKEERFLEKSSLFEYAYCKRTAECQPLNYTTCMGAKLPYHSTTLNLTDLSTQEMVQEKLHIYQYLRYIPKCWAVIQPFLCALYMPKCEKGYVDLPSREMCRITLSQCKILFNTSVFPEFLNCEDERLFPSKCKNDVHELKFNTTGFCMEPLVKTDKDDRFYPDVEGCDLRCKDSLYTENEHYQIHKLVAYCVILCIFLNLFTIVTFIIDWKTANKYPALAIFYVNVCFFISYSGWLVQFLGNETREDVVCKKDGTLRKSEPSATENLSCVIVFVMVYYFLIAGMVWFIIFSYAWYMSSLQALGKSQERVDKKRAYFHLVAWSFPLILTITTMAIGEIDGDYVTGICFVGFVSIAARTGLLLAPLAGVMILSGYIIVRGLILLVKVQIESREIISEHSSKKIRSNIVRMGVFAFFMIMFCMITFAYHSYLSVNSTLWNDSLHKYILCKLTSLSSDVSHCKQELRPSVAMLQLQLLAVFGAGIAMASWVWCDATFKAWTRYIRRKVCEKEAPMKLQKHQLIAETYAKRKEYIEGDKISINWPNHNDLVGLRIDLVSAGSSFNDVSTWANHIGRLLYRRGALPNEDAYSQSSNNQSIDSEVSLNVRHVSIESRRNSGDSQLSVQIAEVKATSKRRHRSRHKNNYRYTRNKGHFSRRSSKTGQKCESSTSLDSYLKLMDVISNCKVSQCQPNLNRRIGNAGLDGQTMKSILPNNKSIQPFNFNINSGSEEENVSVTISEGKFSLYRSNKNNFDLNDKLMMESLKQGIHIQELSTSSDSDDARKRDKDFGQEKRYSKSGRDSHSSKKSRLSKKSKKKYCSNSESNCDVNEKGDNSDDGSSSCPEIKQLVQSSLNSGVSVGCERNRGSRQSKTSNDVAVQADADDIVTQTAAYDLEMQNLRKTDDDKHKSKHAKTKENKKYKRASKYCDITESQEKKLKKKEKYMTAGSSEEKQSFCVKDSNKKYSDVSDDDEESLLKNKYKVNIKKSKEVT